MKTLRFDGEEDWMEARRGKITGSRLKGLIVKRGTADKMEFYELLAERLALPPTGENPMDRGHRLEEEAVAAFTEHTGKEVNTDLVMWVSDINERIALSPDGYMDNGIEAVEVKCLKSALHLKAFIKQEIPTDYEEQVIQYFIVNEKLETLHFVFYDPLLSVHSYHCIVIDRSDYIEKIEKYTADQINALDRVEALINSWTF